MLVRSGQLISFASSLAVPFFLAVIILSGSTLTYVPELSLKLTQILFAFRLTIHSSLAITLFTEPARDVSVLEVLLSYTLFTLSTLLMFACSCKTIHYTFSICQAWSWFLRAVSVCAGQCAVLALLWCWGPHSFLVWDFGNPQHFKISSSALDQSQMLPQFHFLFLPSG